MKYFEVEFWKDYIDENGKVDGGITDYSICIKGLRKPSVVEAELFCAKDIEALGYKGVTRVTELTEKEVHNFYDDENIDKWPIFGEKENKEMKDEKRIIDKAITFTKELINFKDVTFETEGITPINGKLNIKLNIYKGTNNLGCFYGLTGITLRGVDTEMPETGVDERTEYREQSTAIYDLTGRKVENPTKGIYIIDSKKTLIK